MEERIQRKIHELVLEKYSGPFTANAFKNLFPSKYETYAHEVRPEAVLIVEEEIKIEEEHKQKCREDMEKTRIECQLRLKKMQQDKKDEEEHERIQQIQDRENPDKPLTFKDVRAYGFDYEVSRRTLDELNIEILKRIIRREYSHKFKN